MRAEPAVEVSPQIIILAGPNGAGKSTAQVRLISSGFTFVNADNIARDLREAGTSAGPAAGRILIKRMEELTATRKMFCVETNLANKTLAQRIPKWQAVGYKVAVYYLWVPDPELSIARVALRVQAGGHDIPEATIRRRYYQGLRNFFTEYVPLADRWRLYDSSEPGDPVLLEQGARRVVDRATWDIVRRIMLQGELDADIG